jgi:hypothetical protein
MLSVTATTIGVVAGFGELLGYGARLVSGYLGVGLKPTRPFNAAGMRIDPPVSLPIARAAMPSVTEIAALDDEPPGMRPVARSKAFFGVPYGHFVHVVCGSVDGARLVEVGTAGVEVADGEGVPAGLAQGGDQRFPVRDFARRFGM